MWFIVTAFLMCVVLPAHAQENKSINVNSPNEEVILQWNRVLSQTIQIPEAQPSTINPLRSFAMMHPGDVRRG